MMVLIRPSVRRLRRLQTARRAQERTRLLLGARLLVLLRTRRVSIAVMASEALERFARLSLQAKPAAGMLRIAAQFARSKSNLQCRAIVWHRAGAH